MKPLEQSLLMIRNRLKPLLWPTVLLLLAFALCSRQGNGAPIRTTAEKVSGLQADSMGRRIDGSRNLIPRNDTLTVSPRAECRINRPAKAS